MDRIMAQYNLFQRFGQKIFSTRPGSWFAARTFHHLDRAAFRLSGGRWTAVGYASGLPTVVLTSTGAKSGQPRLTPLVGIRDPVNPRRFALIASNYGQDHHPGWYYNLKANPHAHCAIDEADGAYLAHEASDQEYALFWQRACEIYPGYPLYKKRAGQRHIPIMVLEAEPESRS